MDIRESMKIIAESADKLNKLSDMATKRFKMVEVFFMRHGVGIEVFGLSDGGYTLGFARDDGKFRLVARNDVMNTNSPVISMPRDVRIALIALLPDLIVRVASRVQGMAAYFGEEKLNKIKAAADQLVLGLDEPGETQ